MARLRRSTVSDAKHAPHDLGGRLLTVRRLAALAAALVAVSCLVFLLGAYYLWPLFIFPLLLGAVFFFELGSLVVTFWLGNFFVLYYGFRAPATPGVVRQALLGMVLFFIAGLLLGRVQRKNHETQAVLAASSLSDRLTGLYNYGTFVDYLHNEVTKIDRYGGELTLIMLDLDHFKQFNDRHGHETGNEVLRRVGATLRDAVRDADMAARYGGEEFTVLIRGDETRGYELAERLRRAVQTTAIEVRGGGEVFCTVSGGVATYPVGAADETALVERADGALYESKRRGRNRVTIYAGVAAPNELPASLSA
jgi:diguanylate cyclase (GGDEF)-like protein